MSGFRNQYTLRVKKNAGSPDFILLASELFSREGDRLERKLLMFESYYRIVTNKPAFCNLAPGTRGPN